MEASKEDVWQVVTTGPLGGNEGYQVLVRGSVTSARITHILEHLALVRNWLEQDELAKSLTPAAESALSWLERWGAHVGDCQGADKCTCGLTAIRNELAVTLNPQQ